MIAKEKKGSTLAELCVVLALISIVGFSVVSFTTMVSARTTISATRLQMMDDRQLAKVVLENWLVSMTAAGADIQVDANGMITAFLPDGKECSVLLEEERIVAPLPDGTSLTCPIQTLVSLRFECLTRESEDRDAIYFCTADYELPDLAGGTVQRSFTFTLNPHIGDVYQEVGG